MKKFNVYLLIFVLGACSTDSPYLTARKVQLATPDVKTTSIYSTGVNKLTVSHLAPGASLAITHLDTGKEFSVQPDEAFLLQDTGLYAIRAVQPPFLPSETLYKRLLPKGKDIAQLTWMGQAPTKYFKGGSRVLTDGKNAGLSFQDSGWTGADTPFSIAITFAEKTQIDSLVLGVLLDTGAWIFPTAEVVITAMDDPKQKTIKQQLNTAWPSEGPQHQFVTLPVSLEAKSIELKFSPQNLPEPHPGAGQPAWLFMDELIIY